MYQPHPAGPREARASFDLRSRVAAGEHVSQDAGAPLVLMQNGQLKIAEGLRLKDVLVKELLAFRVKINISTAHDSYEAWREGDHDDLVLALALACWAGERMKRLAYVRIPNTIFGARPITS